MVFDDLGLFSHMPLDWLQPGPDGLSFRPLSVREADELTLAVEDLAHGCTPTEAQPWNQPAPAVLRLVVMARPQRPVQCDLSIPAVTDA